jgi:hypothetical protein
LTSNILDTSKITSKTNNMILIWSRYDYNHDYDFKSVNNKDTTTCITVEPDTVSKQFFSGRNLENLINNLQYDNFAISCYVSRSLDKIIIFYKNKKEGSN